MCIRDSDKAAARLHLIAHQDGEGLVCLLGILDGDADDDAVLRVHGGLPELLLSLIHISS